MLIDGRKWTLKGRWRCRGDFKEKEINKLGMERCGRLTESFVRVLKAQQTRQEINNNNKKINNNNK